MDLSQAEQHRTLSVHIYSCLYSIVQLPGASLAAVEVSSTLSENCGQIDRQINRGTEYKGVYRFANGQWIILGHQKLS